MPKTKEEEKAERITRDSFKSKKKDRPSEGPVTREAEQKAKNTGELHPLVDPKGYGIIRRSLIRFNPTPDNRWVVAVGLPMPITIWLDTTSSMGDNVDIAYDALEDIYDLDCRVLGDYDIQISIGIFGDVGDPFVICRPQYEMTAAKIVEQLTLLVPAREGGDIPEDMAYGLFGSAYLRWAYINSIGLKGYNFLISDAEGRDLLDVRQLYRVYGDDVFEKTTENGFQLNPNDLPTITDVVNDLLKRDHAFYLQVGDRSAASSFWTRVYGKERVIRLPRTSLLPQVKAVVTGLTEGSLELANVVDFLRENNIDQIDANSIHRSVAGIPLKAQMALPNFGKGPKKGDIFLNKTDQWPIDSKEIGEKATSADGKTKDDNIWL